MDKANGNAANSSNYNVIHLPQSDEPMSKDTEEDIFTQSGNLFHNYGDYGRYKVMIHVVSLCKRCDELNCACAIKW